MKLKAYLIWIPILCALGVLPVAERANAQVEIILRQEGGAGQNQPTQEQNNQQQPDQTQPDAGQANQVQEVSPIQANPAQVPAEVPLPAAAVPGETEYDRYMRIGYAISRQGDYETARDYFQQALVVNPGDRLATIAYWNMVDALQRSQQQPQQLSQQDQFQQLTQSQPLSQQQLSQGQQLSQEQQQQQQLQQQQPQQLSQPQQQLQQPQQEAVPLSAVTGSPDEPEFDRYMNAGYTATEARDYETALRYFKLALQLRPNDPYATQAIRNVGTYINR